MTGENLDILELARQAKALHAKSVWHGEDSDDAATVLFALASAVETLTREKDQLRYDFVDAAVAEAQLKEQAIKRAEAAEARLAEVEKICHDLEAEAQGYAIAANDAIRERDEADEVVR